MQRAVEFRKKRYWSQSIDVKALDELLAEFNADGWRVVSMIPNTAGLGALVSYTILLDKAE